MTAPVRANRKASDEDIIKLNSVGLSLSAIADVLQCHPTTVTLRLKSLGIEPADTRRSFMEQIYLSLTLQQREWLAGQLGPNFSIKDLFKEMLIEAFVKSRSEKKLMNPIRSCLDWFRKAVPIPVSKNIHTQIGVHFEEVHEMLIEIEPLDEATNELIDRARDAMHRLAVHLKTNDGVIVVRMRTRQNMLDALCDQIVTAIGTAHMLSMNIDGGFQEVDDSNWSKFVNGEPIFDENRKIAKGPNYRRADLSTFV